MKKIIIILAIIFISISARADCYSDYHIKCVIETIDGKISNGYIMISNCLFYSRTLSWNYNDMEDLKNTLKQKQQWWKEVMKDKEVFKDTLRYYQDRRIYEYYDIPYYCNWESIPLEDIKTITVEEVLSEANWIWISSELQLSDSTWIKKAPIKKVEFQFNEGFMYSFQIFIHENSEKINNVIRQLKLKQKEIENIDKRLAEEENDEIYWKLDSQKHDKNNEMSKITKQLNGEKVVVISDITD